MSIRGFFRLRKIIWVCVRDKLNCHYLRIEIKKRKKNISRCALEVSIYRFFFSKPSKKESVIEKKICKRNMVRYNRTIHVNN